MLPEDDRKHGTKCMVLTAFRLVFGSDLVPGLNEGAVTSTF
jgi:hypothetical protein